MDWRSKIEKTLHHFLFSGHPSILPPHVFIFGTRGSGKTHLIKEALKSVSACYIPCATIFLVSHIFRIISEWIECAVKNFTEVEMLLSNRKNVSYLVFDDIGYLIDRLSAVFPVLLRLHDATDRKTCCIFISSRPFSSYGILSYSIHIPPYSREEVLEILKNKYKSIVDSWTINLVLDVFYPITTNLRYLDRRVAKVKESGIHRRRKNVLEYLNSLVSNMDQVADPFDIQSSTPAIRQVMISAYLATHNPQRTDVAIFGTAREYKRRRTYEQKGAVFFSLKRLVAILRSLFPSSHIRNSQVTVSSILHQLSGIGGLLSIQGEMPGLIRYKSKASYEMIEKISRTFGMNINDYLFYEKKL